MTSAIVNKIIPFSSVDGPGNRTAVFLQGCNINCKYCHNPETRKLCIACGACVDKCPQEALSVVIDSSGEKRISYDASRCVACDTCIHVCQHDASPRVTLMTAEETYARVRKQIPFIRGITVSGGECMLNPEFVRELFELAKEDGLSTLIDSNGTIDFSLYPHLMAVTDGVMLDIKAFSGEEHIKVTGSPNDIVLKNASFLGKEGKLYEVRAVIVPDLYNTKQSIESIGDYLLEFYKTKKFRIKIIAYRPMGVREEYSHYEIPSQEYLDSLKNILEEKGFEEIIII